MLAGSGASLGPENVQSAAAAGRALAARSPADAAALAPRTGVAASPGTAHLAGEAGRGTAMQSATAMGMEAGIASLTATTRAPEEGAAAGEPWAVVGHACMLMPHACSCLTPFAFCSCLPGRFRRRDRSPPEDRLAREKERELKELERATRTIFASNINLKVSVRCMTRWAWTA